MNSTGKVLIFYVSLSLNANIQLRPLWYDYNVNNNNYVMLFYSSRQRSAIVSLPPPPSSRNPQCSPHLCRPGQSRAQAPLLTSWTKRTHASYPCSLSPRVRFRARFLCCSPLTLREHHLGLPVPLWLSRNSSAVRQQELQVRFQQRQTLRYGHMSHFHNLKFSTLASSSGHLALPWYWCTPLSSL